MPDAAFLSYDYKRFSAALAAATAKTHDGYKANRAYYNGDHWQGGDAWIGPIPRTNDGQIDSTRFALVQRQFVSKNDIGEIVDRAVGSLLGNEPSWRLVPRRALKDDEQPNTDEQERIDEAEAALTTDWDEHEMLKLLKDALRTAFLAGRAPWRNYVPPGLRDDVTGRVTAKDLPEGLSFIYADPVPEPDVCAVIEDASTKQKAGVWVYTEDNKQYMEVVCLDPATKNTIYLTIRDGDTEPAQYMVPSDGTLPIMEIQVPLLVTPQVRQLQNDQNLHLTMKSHNGVLGGFLERVITNAAAPGVYEVCSATDAGAESDGNGGYKRFIPMAYRTGAGSINFLNGIPIRDGDGKITGYTSPGIQYREPVTPTTFIAARMDSHAALLEEVQQLHALLSGDAVVSGESRKQALTDFVNSILQAKSEVEKLIRTILSNKLGQAAAFMGQPGRYADLRPDLQLRMYTGPISDSERDQNRQDVDDGLMAPETAMERNGIEDTDAELAMINANKQRSETARTIGVADGIKQSTGMALRATALQQNATAGVQGQTQIGQGQQQQGVLTNA